MDRVLLATRAARDLRHLGPGPELDRIEAALQRLDGGAANLDVKPLTGSAPWLRLRVGDWRILFRTADEAVLVARIIHRTELQQALRTLE